MIAAFGLGFGLSRGRLHGRGNARTPTCARRRRSMRMAETSNWNGIVLLLGQKQGNCLLASDVASLFSAVAEQTAAIAAKNFPLVRPLMRSHNGNEFQFHRTAPRSNPSAPVAQLRLVEHREVCAATCAHFGKISICVGCHELAVFVLCYETAIPRGPDGAKWRKFGKQSNASGDHVTTPNMAARCNRRRKRIAHG